MTIDLRLFSMFTTQGLFKSTQCPHKSACSKRNCLFSHADGLAAPNLGLVVVNPPALPSTVPEKRPAASLVPKPTSRSLAPVQEPPRKIQRTGPTARSRVAPAPSQTETGVPILRINPAQSIVAIPVRQTMLKTLYEHFTTLYKGILASNPSLASEHALKQEEEVCKKSTKHTYRNAIIQSIAALKRRPIPTSISHPSVGTEDEIAAREEARRELEALRLNTSALERLVHPVEQLEKWGYFVEVPSTPGGTEPSLEGKITKCERCGQPFQVKRMEDAEKCVYHWGKALYTRQGGERTRVYTCCSRPADTGEGCSQGPHVFYESDIDILHSRHPFSTVPASSPKALDVVALDCEMVYSTGGMRVARVSVVDGAGKLVLDELIKMDDGVHVIDYNTRFSGIDSENYAKATKDLASVRESLHRFIDSHTIIIGHALENDLKTLRIVHHRCVDTALLFPHKSGPPYRRSLKDLVREKLARMIQTGGSSTGHSSLEDASATLDLVRWFILNEQKPPVV